MERISDAEDFDIVVVGAGIAGLTLVGELAYSGYRIALIESGTDKKTELADQLKFVHSEGIFIKEDSRERLIGGSAHTWGGLSALFDPIDYTQRPFPHHIGWPFAAEELAPYLSASCERYRFPELEAFDNFDVFFQGAKNLCCWNTLSKKIFLAQIPAVRYAALLAGALRRESVTIFRGTTVTAFESSEVASGRRAVTSARCKDEHGRERLIRGKRFVLAAGGIENPRILLNSPAGETSLGNEHDQVGRYLMNHPKGYGGSLKLHAPMRVDSPYLPSRRGPYFGYLGLRLSEELQKSEGLLNCYVLFRAVLPWTGSEVLERARKAVREFREYRIAGMISALARFALCTPGLLYLGALRLAMGRVQKTRVLKVNFIAEMEPNPENRVTLSPDETDRVGAPVPIVRHSLSERDKASLRTLAERLMSEVSSIGTYIGIPDDAVEAAKTDASHHLGATRMGVDPHTSVVNSDCRVHSVENLYVAGCSIFPTSGCANPTMVMSALTIRLAEHLKRILPRSETAVKSAASQKTRRVAIIGAGRRVREDVLPVFEAAPEFYSVDSIYAKHEGVFFGKDREYEIKTIESLSNADVQLIYVAVPPGEVSAVLEIIRRKIGTHVTVILDTPVPLDSRSLRVMEEFKDVRIAEDSAYLPWLQALTAYSAAPLVSVIMANSVYRYHGIALAKALCGRADGEIPKVSRAYRIGSNSKMKIGGCKIAMREPRDYAKGVLDLSFQDGAKITSAKGARQIKLIQQNASCVGFSIGDVRAMLSDIETRLLGPVAEDDTVISRMLDIKRVGLYRMLCAIAKREPTWNLEQGKEDSRVSRRLFTRFPVAGYISL